ncbi:hypothetical protein HZB69_01695 [Candidatus Amesbacteria bacterium]|nr:hypothetical protein [Candidatus Amesbacteria bacterium]
MKILFLMRYKWPHIGGVEKHVHMITRELAKKHEIKYLTEKEVGTDKWEIWRNIWKYKRLFDWADVVHIHDVFFWIWTFVTFHGWEGVYPVPWKNIVVRKISEWMADGNICVGEFIRKYYYTKADFIIYGAAEKQITRRFSKKDAIFVGKDGKDLEFYKKLAHKMKVKLDVFTSDPNASKYFYKYKYAFVNGYLAILEAMSQNTQVYAYYDNPLKYDYLNMTPFNNLGYKVPTWDRIADIYEKLWQK